MSKKYTELKTELCVIGGGVSGLCAAVAAARAGVRVVLIQDRNVLGGNASGEIRMWIRGAGNHFPEYREGGLIEELALDNMHYNPRMNYSLWDAVLYNKAAAEKNITLLLGTTCNGAFQKGNKIVYVNAWQLNSYRNYKIFADYFADCSGDSVLTKFTDAAFTSGRESKEEYAESLAPDRADKKTMGNSCLLRARKKDDPAPHVPFPFEIKLPEKVFEGRIDPESPDFRTENFWWLETGGTQDTIKDAAKINGELIAVAFSGWNRVSNSAARSGWELDWVGFLQGKRESRRYLGDYVLTQNDIEQSRAFDDEIAYGGWSMDEHNPEGLYGTAPNVYHPIPKPYAIPYRCLFSKNVENLFFAGRNVSVTHLALSSTRVMGTCGMLGQAVGSACALAKKYAVMPRDVLKHTDELKQALLNADCFLLHTERKFSEAIADSRNNLEERFGVMLKNREREAEARCTGTASCLWKALCFTANG